MAYNPQNPNGSATSANSAPVVIASNQAAVPVSGPLTDVQLRTTPVPVSGTFYQATQPVSGTFYQATQPVSIAASVAVTGPLTDTQLRASAVPIIQTSSATVGGVSAVTGSSSGGSSSIAVVGAPAQVYGWYFYNANTVAAYIGFYNLVTGTVSSTPFYVLVVPPVGGANVFGIGITHSVGVCITIATTRPAGGTALSVPVDYNIFYK
jgi:hypothetical protein